MTAKLSLLTGLALMLLPTLGLTHPGHGLDGLIVHDVLHVLTALSVTALLLTLCLRGYHRFSKRNRND